MFKKIMSKALTGLTAGLLVLMPLSANGQEALTIGGNYELSGSAASYGTPMSNASKLAVELANKNGGVLGKEVTYIEYDNKSDLTEASSVATRLISEGATALVGAATTADVMAQVGVAQEEGVPVVAPAATGDGITVNESGLIDYFFRVCFEDGVQGRATAKYVKENLGASKVAMVVDQGVDNSVGLSGAFEKAFKEAGGEIVTTQYYTEGDTDFTTIVTSLLAEDFDVIYLPAYYNEGGLFVKQAREMGITQPIFGNDGLSSPTFNELAGKENVTDVYYTAHFNPQSQEDKVVEFVKNYQDKYGQEPDGFAALAYDATNLILDATQRAGSTDPAAIKDALAQTKDFEGITGVFSIDEENNPIKPVLMLKFTAGELESAEEIVVE